MSELTVEPRAGGGYVVIWPNGDKAEWPLSSEAFRYTIDDRRRRLRELEAIEEYEKRQPEIPVGTAGTATVRGVKGVRVMYCRDPEETTAFWWSAQFVKSARVHTDEQVTDFVPDTLLTDEAAEKIRAEERERIAVQIERPVGPGPLTMSTRRLLATWLRDGAK